jgi:hypothetical protein
MRKYKKDIIIDLTKSLIEAHEELLVIIKNRDYAKAYNLLEVCQHAAYSIGTSIEESESNSDEIIPELEAFCDDLYLIGSNLTNDEYDLDPVFESIASRFDIIESYIKEKIKITYEIVFLPYNASMWDSMESVWLAASNDPSCSCYVIPIPYYEKTASGTELKYEGASFPKYVPVVHYNDYSIPDRKPDIIYIHNPFDQYNRVTSVHPAFYSSELKKHTNMLVYIPYFITGRFVPDTFLNLPSYKNIDKIVIQSHHQLSFYRRYIPSEKLVALGSPKVDKVISMNKGCVEIPEEWKSKAENKRVIFYNTSLSGLLKYREKALDKMEYVFSVFARREKEVLLWRPHPLSKATLRSMLPAFYRRYCELEKKFINSNIGIYDDTPDVSSSIALSDAYIGEEGSSIVHLFGVLGKPIFLLDISITSEQAIKSKNLVGCMDAYKVNEDLWFVSCHYNALCKMDINTGSVEIVGSIPSENMNEERLYHDVIEMNDKLYFAPHRAKDLVEYDLKKEIFRKIALKRPPYPEKSLFTRMVRYKEYLYLLPTYYSSVVRYDTINGTFKYYTDLLNDIRGEYDGDIKEAPEFMNAMYIEDNLLLLASSRSNAIIEFNMETEKFVIHKVGKESNTYYRMEYDGYDYWLIPHDSKSIVRWNRKTGNSVEYSDYPEGFTGEKNAFLTIICCGKYMLVFPKKANMIIKIDIETGIMSEFKLNLPYKEGERKDKYYNWPNNYYFIKMIDERHLAALSAYDCSLVLIDTKTEDCKIRKCYVNNKASILRFGSIGDNIPYACSESNSINVEDFLLELEVKKVFNPQDQIRVYASIVSNIDGTCGDKIHNYIMEQMEI